VANGSESVVGSERHERDGNVRYHARSGF
jgi:hypothetical protein